MTCRLCKREEKLCDSHIIPEFLFKNLYDSKHRAVELFAKGYKRFVQKGLRDSLLCTGCEGHIARYIEAPFAKQWEKVLPSSYSNPIFPVSGLNYAVTKLMILTNLWRAHCSNKMYWESGNLGPYAEKIREMIRNLDPGDEKTFPIWGQLLVDRENNVHADVITPFTQSRLNRHHFYYAIFGGVEWYIVISESTEVIMKDACLTKHGTMQLIKKFLLKSNSMKNYIRSRPPYSRGL
jgi:hypothetical protein